MTKSVAVCGTLAASPPYEAIWLVAYRISRAPSRTKSAASISLVVQNLVDGAIPAGECEPVDAENDQTEMAERRKCKQSPEIPLYQRQTRTVENADDCERNQKGATCRACAGNNPT